MKTHPRLQNWLAYTALAALILAPLLLPGYILTFDMSWTPRLPALSVGNNDVVFHALLKALAWVLPSALVQKLLLLGIFVVAGVGAHRLSAGRMGEWAAYLAGLVYVVNPFTYTRLMAGQYLVLGGYALLPWFVRAVARLLEQPGRRRAAVLVAWGLGVGAVSIHSVGFLALLLVVVALAWGWGREWAEVRPRLAWLGLAVGAWLVASSYWLVPLVLGSSRNAKAIAGFDAGQFRAYATTGGHVGVPLNVLSLQGFWSDVSGRYVLADATGWLFWLMFALLAVLVGLGAWRGWRARDRLAIGLVVSALVAWVLAMGIAWPPVAGLTHWLVNYVPFYKGYREPQKWAALLALAYSYLAASGLVWVGELVADWRREIVGLGSLLVVLLWVPMLLWGAGGQLRSTWYPASWYALNQRLNALPAGGVVVFPWHQYLFVDFAGRTVANPAAAFFDRPVVAGDDPELSGVAPPRTNAVSRMIENRVLPGQFFETDAARPLAAVGVRYVVVLKQADWENYGWLDAQTGLKRIGDNPGWRLYQVEAGQ